MAGNSAAAAEMKEIAALMRDSGLEVYATSGWEGMGVSSSVNYWAVLEHHTAATEDITNMLINGRSDLPGPLCNWELQKYGRWGLIASGRANHAGEGTLPSSESYGIEATGPQNYPDTYGPNAFPDNYNSYVTGVACILAVMNADVSDVFGHKETARPVGRKIDPYFDMGQMRSKVDQGIEGEDMTSDDWAKLNKRFDKLEKLMTDHEHSENGRFKLVSRGEYEDGTVDEKSQHFKDSNRGIYTQVTDTFVMAARGQYADGSIDANSQHYKDSRRGIYEAVTGDAPATFEDVEREPR